MNLRALKIFRKVVQTKNMTRAAEELFISQSSVSQTIKEIEQQYDIILFERINRKLYITTEGEKFLFYANQIIELYQDLEDTMHQKTLQKEIRVGATITIGTYLLPKMISDIIGKLDNVLLKSVVINTETIRALIGKNEIDLGLVEGEILKQDIIMKPFMNDELILICSKDNPLSKLEVLQENHLEHVSLIIREINSGSRKLILKKLQESNINFNIIGEYNNTEAIINAVTNSMNVGVISKRAVKQKKNLEYHVLNTPFLDLSRKFFIAYHKNKKITPNLETIFNYLETLE